MDLYDIEYSNKEKVLGTFTSAFDYPLITVSWITERCDYLIVEDEESDIIEYIYCGREDYLSTYDTAKKVAFTLNAIGSDFSVSTDDHCLFIYFVGNAITKGELIKSIEEMNRLPLKRKQQALKNME